MHRSLSVTYFNNTEHNEVATLESIQQLDKRQLIQNAKCGLDLL